MAYELQDFVADLRAALAQPAPEAAQLEAGAAALRRLLANASALDRCIIHTAAERLDAEPADPTVIPFPTPIYDREADRFALTAKGEAYRSGAAEPPLA